MVANIIEYPYSAGVLPTPYNPDPVLLSVMEIIREGLRRDHYVRLHNFGTFRLRWSKPRRVKHPKTGEYITVPPAPKVSFTPAKYLRDLIEPDPKPVIPVEKSTNKETPSYASHTAKLATFREKQKETIKPSSNLSEAVQDILDQQYQGQQYTPSEIPAITDQQTGAKKPFNKKTLLGLLAAVPLLVALLQADFGGDEPTTTTTQPASETAQTSESVQPVQNKILRTTAVTPNNVTSNDTALNKATLNKAPSNSIVSSNRQDSTAKQAESQFLARSKSTPRNFFLSPQLHTIQKNDNLWNLAKQYYGNALLWPHIYRANRRTLTDPDKIITGKKLVIPGLQESPGKLTQNDRTQVAEGYFQVYQFKKDASSKEAIYFLIGAKHYSYEWLQQNSALIAREDWLAIQK
jgi:nucleoid-associated protein YgaU/nucleoid DNA-binding protein